MQHLPPICLQLRLGQRYPSERPPEVALSALWLNAEQAAQLERQLLRLWDEQGPGGPVCYSWVDWLQSSALACLGICESLVLGGSGSGSSSAGGSGSRRLELQAGSGEQDAAAGGAVAGGGAERVLLNLLRYDAAEEHRQFQQQNHTW